jgi:hypothetical protein
LADKPYSHYPTAWEIYLAGSKQRKGKSWVELESLGACYSESTAASAKAERLLIGSPEFEVGMDGIETTNKYTFCKI